MKEMQDTVQVGLANITAIGISLSEVNEVLTFVSLGLAIGFSIYKFMKYEKTKTK
jgi:EamA domain-containing membrane protein RarD